MDPATLADTVRSAAFRSTQFRDGYDEGAVDQLLDELVRAIVNGSSGTEVAAIASNARLPTTSMRRGYDCDDVNDLLDEVVRQASGVVRSSHHAPVPVSEERSGLGTRLLRLVRGE